MFSNPLDSSIGNCDLSPGPTPQGAIDLRRAAVFWTVGSAILVLGCEARTLPEGRERGQVSSGSRVDGNFDDTFEDFERLEALTNVFRLPDEAERASIAAPQVVEEEERLKLVDLGITLVPLEITAGERPRTVLFSEAEITNNVFAKYLADTHRFRDDLELLNAMDLESGLSTASPSIHVFDRASLWKNGVPPAGRDEHPVSFLDIEQAVEFCSWLNQRYRLGGTFRLPTESEWMFAAYGTDRSFPWGNEEKNWQGQSTEPVKTRSELQTPDGLYGMWGNVAELVLSPSDGYGGVNPDPDTPGICQWLGTSYREEHVRGEPTQPRQEYWGYTHSLKSRSDTWGFRVVYVTELTLATCCPPADKRVNFPQRRADR